MSLPSKPSMDRDRPLAPPPTKAKIEHPSSRAGRVGATARQHMVSTWIRRREGPAAGPGGDVVAVVVGTHPIEAGQDVWLEVTADDVPLGPVARLLAREQGGQQPLACADPAPGGSASGSTTDRRRSMPRVGAGDQPVPGHDRPAEPARPRRVAEIVAVESRGPGRQPDDDRPGRSPGGRPTTSTSRPSACTPTSAPPDGDWPQSRSHFRADRRRPGGRPAARLVHRAALLGGVPALPGGDEPPDDRADLAERADPGPGHRLRRDGRLRCPGRPAGPLSPGQYIKRFRIDQRGDRAAAGPLRRVYPGRGQRRDRRPGPELARRRPDPPGDQPRPRPRQPEARARLPPSSSPSRSTAGATSTASRPARTRRSCSAGSTCRRARR